MGAVNTVAESEARSACRWIKENGRAFKSILRFLHTQVDMGNPRTMRGDVYAYARRSDIAMCSAGEFVRDNNMYAVLMRYAVMMRPSLANTVHFKHSTFDDIDLAGIWHETVNAGTVFLASSAEEAKAMVASGDACAEVRTPWLP